MRKNRRFCSLRDLSSARVDKNTDVINDTLMIDYSSSDLTDIDATSTAYLFQRVQNSSRRRYRVLLSLISTMTLIATAVAVISVTVKKMSSNGNNELNVENRDDGLWFSKDTHAPAESPGIASIPAVATTDPKQDPEEEHLGELFSLPPIFAEVQVTIPPALGASNQPNPSPDDVGSPNTNNTPKPIGPFFAFPPISTIRTPFPTTLMPTTLEPSEKPTRMPVDHDMKRPSYLDLTPPPFPPTKKPSPAPTPLPTRRPRTQRPTTNLPTMMTEPPRMPTLRPIMKPTHAPFSPFLDIVRPVMLPSKQPNIASDQPLSKTYMPTNSPSQEITADNPQPTPRPTRKPKTPSPATKEPTGTPTNAATLNPRRTRRPTNAPITKVPISQPPVPSTLAPIIVTVKPTPTPTDEPTHKPAASPTTLKPTPTPITLTKAPTTLSPTPMPTIMTNKPTTIPTKPTPQPTQHSTPGTTTTITTNNNTPPPTPEDVVVVSNLSFQPGDLTIDEVGLKLSTGLTARIVATSGKKVVYSNGELSKVVFHGRPDAGATFPDTRAFNPGGWVYVSNSEMRTQDPPGGAGNGGVGAITFDAHGNILHYDMILSKTTWNCGGGRTPWNTWISCEEAPKGVIWQVDPMGGHTSEKLTMGSTGGRWESFTYDIGDLSAPHFFVTEDHVRGALNRFTPSPELVNWQRPWVMLHGNGTTDYLYLTPNAQGTGGTYKWIPQRGVARANAEKYYPNCEGIDSNGESIFFVSKRLQQMFELNLRDNTYINLSTVRGLFDGRPDQISRILANSDGVRHTDDILYFTEEGGVDAGVHGRGPDGKFFTILEGPGYKDETSGLAFSPDGKHLYIAYQENGILFDVTRKDGYPFHAKSLNVKYHATS